jgi:hypothetical protein
MEYTHQVTVCKRAWWLVLPQAQLSARRCHDDGISQQTSGRLQLDKTHQQVLVEVHAKLFAKV